MTVPDLTTPSLILIPCILGFHARPRRHRGPHPEDARLFAPALCRGVAAGDGRAGLAAQPRLSARVVAETGGRPLCAGLAAADRRRRCALSDQEAARRARCQAEAEALAGRPLWLDGYNVLTTVEAALAGGVVLAARDGAYRDMASMHGSYRKVAETRRPWS